MKQSTRTPFSRLWLFLVALVAAVVIPVVATTSASAAVEVGNPGPFVAKVTGGNLKIKATELDLGTIVPAPTLTGTINADGTYVIPTAGVNFPPYILDYQGDPVNVLIQATGPAWTGTIDPDTGGLTTDLGSMDLNGRLRVKLEGNVGGQDLTGSCYIGASGTGDNTNLAPATSGTQPAFGNAQAVTGDPYDPETGATRIVNNKFTVPGASGCALLGLGNGILNDALGLPSATGENAIALNLETTPKILPPVNTRYTASPVEGRVPFNVDFDASASTSAVGPITDYKWDFDGDGTVDQTTATPTTSHNYEIAGVYPTRLTVVSGGLESTKQRQTITAKAVVTDFTEQAPASSQDRDTHFEFVAKEDGAIVDTATFECRLDQGAVVGTYAPCTSPVDYTDMVDNDYVLRVRATVGGSTGLPAVASFRVDNISPAASITGQPASPVNATITDGNVAFDSNEPGSTFECRFTPTTNDPDPPAPEFAPCDSPTAVSWAAVEGTNTFDVRPTDRAGNVGAVTTATWVVDLTPPTSSLTYSPPSPTNAVGGTYARQCFLGGLVCFISPSYEEVTSAGNTAQRFDFTGNEPGSTYICKWNDQNERPCTSGIQTGSGVAAPGAAVKASLGTGQRRLGNSTDVGAVDMLQGDNTFRVWAVDAAGNRQTNPTSYTLVYDTVKPTITAVSAPPAWTKSASHTILFQSNEPVQTNTFQCRFIQNTGNTVTSFATGSGTSTGWVTCDPGQLTPTLGWFNTSTVPGLLTDGRKGLQVRATDIAGNVDTTNNDVLTGNGPGLTKYWTVDNGVPVATFAAGGTQQGINTSSTSATINLAATDTPVNFGTNQTGTNAIPAQTPVYECSLNEFGSTTTGFTPCTTPVQLTGLTPGKKSLRVRVTDQATNVSANIERSWTVVDDSNASVTLVNKPAAVSGSKDATFDFTPNNASSQCRIDATEAQNLADSNWTSCPSGTMSYTGLAEGGHRVEIRASSSDIPVIYEWNIYSTVPVATFQSQPGILRPDGKRYTGLNQNSASITFSAPANPGYAPGATTFECSYYIDGQAAPAFTPCTSPYNASWNKLNDGQVRKLDVRPTSSTNNQGLVATASWTIVSSNPAVDLGNPANDLGDGNTRRTACGTGVVNTYGSPGCVATANSTQPGLLSNVTAPQFQAYSSKPIAIPVTGTIPAVGFACQLNTGAIQDPCTGRANIAAGPRSDGKVLTVTLGGTRSATSDSFGATPVTNAENTFTIWAVDLGGNRSNPVTYTWTTDSTIPGFAITSPTPARTNATNVVVDIHANEEISADPDGFRCYLSPVNTSTTANTVALTSYSNCTTRVDGTHAEWVGAGLAEGNYNLDIRGYDLLRQAQSSTSTSQRPTTTDNSVNGRRYSFTVDRTAPVSNITSGVANNGTVGTGTGQFAFQTNEPAAQIASYECRLDPADPADLSGGWSACTSPYSYSDLEDGEHVFQVRALDTAGNQGLPLTRDFTVNSTKPEIELSSDLSGSRTNDTTVNIKYTVDPANSVAECRLIGPDDSVPADVAWGTDCGDLVTPVADPNDPGAPVEDPYVLATYEDLADGDYTFQLRATNSLSVLSDTSELNWTVDTAAPDVTIDSGPDNLTKASTAAFEFSSTDEDATFACQLDDDAPGACTSPKNYSSLGEGEHTLKVVATDDVGNSSAPASRTWEVDLTAPVATITSGPDATTEEKFSTFEFESDDAGATLECDLDGEGFDSEGCESPKEFTVQTGHHKFKVRATDAAGNTGDAAEYDWTVNEPPTCAEGQTGTPPNCVDPPIGETRRIVASLTEGTLSLGPLGEVPLTANQLVMDGGLYANGNWIVPKSGITFQTITQDLDVPNLGAVTVKITLAATGGGSGTLTNGGGAATFNLPVQAKIEALLGTTPLVGPEADCALRPVTFDLTGTYNEAGDIVNLASTTIAFPTVSAGCGPLGATINGLLGLPRNDIAIDLTFNTVKSAAPTECPEGTSGTFPDCVDNECPEGQVGTLPNCTIPPVDKCDPPKVGTPPNCVTPPPPACKKGQTGTPPNCVDPQKVVKLGVAKIKGKKKVKAGKKVTIKYGITNLGDAGATKIKVCLKLKKAKKLAKGKAKRCKTIASIAPGERAFRRFKVKTKKVAKKKRLKFVIVSTYRDGDSGNKRVSKKGHVTVLK